MTHPGPRPLRVMFIITSMEVGGSETLMAQLLEGLDHTTFATELCCLKQLGPLGEQLRQRVPAFSNLLRHKYDLRVWPRLTRLLRERRIDAVVTFGTGDKMFWGRLAARRVGVPVVISALHSTGWPEQIGRLNRLLTPITDVFVAVAEAHGHYLVEHEGLPRDKVRVIHNGVDAQRFRSRTADASLWARLDLPPGTPVAGCVGMLRPEKNHALLLRAARRVCDVLPQAHFVLVGDGPERRHLEELAGNLQLGENVRFLGMREDVAELLAAFDVFLLTSHVEANPVSVLEAMASGKPVIATRVGSVPEIVQEGKSGFLANPGDEATLAQRIVALLQDPALAQQMGAAARESVVSNWTLEKTIAGYESLIATLHARKAQRFAAASASP